MADINWGSVADWVSGIGSLSAAVVALYLARKAEKIKLKGYCGLRVIIGHGVPRVEVLTVSVTNIGTRSTIINNIGLQVGKGRKKRLAIINIVKDEYSVGIPYSLTDGQIAHWSIQLDAEKSWIKDLCKDFVTTKDDVDTLRFSIHTNHDVNLLISPEDNLKKAIFEAVISSKD